MRKNVFIKGILILFCFCLLFALQAPGSMRAGKTKSFSATVKVGKKGAKEKNFSVVDDVAHNGKKFIYMPKIQEGYKIVNVSTRPFIKVNHTEGGEYEFSVRPEDITIYFEIEPIRYRIAFDGDKTPPNKMSTASIFSTGNIVIWVGAGVLVVAIVVLSIFFVKKKK